MTKSWVGKVIGGRYQIESLLGQGGMSAVYKATDPNLSRKVAIKMIHPHLSNNPNFVSRFKEEATAVARLRHSNIVQVHDFNVDGETYYMVMEYLVGVTLQARLKSLNATGKHMPLDEVLRLCIQLCEAIGYAHNHELIHRDIKPANILLNVNGQAILLDFGIVKIIGGDYHTSTGTTTGTAMYMSPEQIRSDRIDGRADIYSLGVTLYEMLSGQPPFMADSAPSVMMMVLNDPLPDLRDTYQEVSDGLLAVVNKALAKEPNERFQAMTQMEAALRQVQMEIASVTPALVATLVDEGELDRGRIESKTTFSTQPTEMMKQGSFIGKEQLPTVAMSEETRAEISGEPVKEQVSEKEVVDQPLQKTEIPDVSQEEKKVNQEIKDGSPGKLSWLKSRPVVIGLIAIILILILVLSLTNLPGNTACKSVETCMTLRTELQEKGDLEGALGAMDRATSRVPPGEHPLFAWIWCERAVLLDQLGRVDEANENRMICDIWSNGG